MNRHTAALSCTALSLCGVLSAEVLQEPVHVQHHSSQDHITYGFTADSRATSIRADRNLSVAAQLNSHNTALEGVGHSFGVATEAWNSPEGSATIHQIGLEASVISLNSSNEGAKVGLAVNIKNRRDGVTEPSAGVGDNKYNYNSRAIQINSLRPSHLGESLGWNTGIDFREYALAGSDEAEPVAIDLAKMGAGSFAILKVADRINGRVYRVYVDNGEIVLEED